MSHWIERIKTSVGEITSLVALLVGYGMGVTGMSPTPWPQTTAVLLVVVSTAFLTRQWWSRIIRQSGLFLVGKTTTQLSWREQLADPFRSRNRISYLLPLTRRRIEGALLSAVILGTLASSTTKISSIVVEVNPSIETAEWKNCEGDGSRKALLVVVTEFNETNAPLLFEDRLYEQLSSRIKWLGKIRVCRSERVIGNQSEAVDFGEQVKAAMIIWGRSDPSLYEVNIEIAEWDLPEYELRSFPTPDAQTSSFQKNEPPRTSFFVEYILSQILYLRGDESQARELLMSALSSEQIDELKSNLENNKDLTDAYFLLGYFFDKPESSEPDLDLAIEYYSQALGIDDTFYPAYINRGQVYKSTKQYEKAVEDFKTAASLTRDSNPDLASAALINTAWIYVDKDATLADDFFAQAITLDSVEGYRQRGLARLFTWKRPDQAIEDFLEALALSKSDPYLYHFLGQAQLLNDQPQDAIQTYQNAISAAKWEPGDRDTIIEDLRDLGQGYPDTYQTVMQIIQTLESGN